MNKPSTPESTAQLTRRRVFAGVGTAGALAAVAAALPIGGKAVPAAAAAVSPAPADDAQGRYQLTQHVARYYRTAQV